MRSVQRFLLAIGTCFLLAGSDQTVRAWQESAVAENPAGPSASANSRKYEVGIPPADLKLDTFYTKHVSASGYPITGSAQVNDYALREAAWLVDQMLAERPDIREAMIKSGSRLCVIAHNEYTTDLPEWKWMGNPKQDGRQSPGVSARDYWDARARGLGGSETDPYCSCGEENLLGYRGDPYSTECILIHEFAHNIHLRGLNQMDSDFDQRLRAAYDSAMAAGLWKGVYASVNYCEYFAEGVQSWFSNNREDDHDHNHVNTREELEAYDPELAKLCREVFGDTKLVYSKPVTRLRDHLEGYDPQSAPEFRWPKRLVDAHAAILEAAQRRNREAQSDKRP
jgi:hypothetical protein